MRSGVQKAVVSIIEDAKENHCQLLNGDNFQKLVLYHIDLVIFSKGIRKDVSEVSICNAIIISQD